jgi:hypothetical protein
MDPLSGRVVAWLIRAASSALVFAGGALFVAAIPTWSATSGAIRDVLVVVLQIGGAWVLLGLAAGYISRRHAAVRPGRWTIVLALILLTVAAWLALALRPFLAEWREVASLLSSSDLWRNANANMSGVVLIPMAAALTPPFIELAALAAFVGFALAMLVLAVTRSARFPTLYLASALVLTALVVGSWRGAAVARMTAEALQPLIEESKPRPEEYAVIRGGLDRYTAAVLPTATTLAWAWLGYALWIPPVLLAAIRR